MGSVVFDRMPSTTFSRRSTAWVAQSALMGAGTDGAVGASTSPGSAMAGHYPHVPMRPLLAVLAAAALGAGAGVVSGEYAMAVGILPITVAVLLGLCESEVVSAVWRERGIVPRLVAALAAGLGV